MLTTNLSRTSTAVVQFRHIASKDQSRLVLLRSLSHVSNLNRPRFANLLKFISIATRESNKNNLAACEISIDNISAYLAELGFPESETLNLAQHTLNLGVISGMNGAHIKEYFLGFHTMSQHVKDFIRSDLGIALEDMRLKSRDIDRGLSLANPLLLEVTPGKEDFLELWTRFGQSFKNQRRLGPSSGSILGSCYLPATEQSGGFSHPDRGNALYYGYLTNGHPDKYGRVIYANNDSYFGGIGQGNFEGYGTFINSARHENYMGFWSAGKKHGYGCITYANKETYVGGWRDDKKSGYGTYNYANGDKYAGCWRDDKKMGNGILTLANGEKIRGIWQNDRSIG